MNNLKIKNKLLVSFVLLFAAMFLVGGLAMWKLSQLSGTAQYLGVERRNMLAATKDIDTAMSSYRLAEANHVYSSEPDQIRKSDQDLTTERALVDKSISYLKPRLIIPKMQALIAQFEQEWSDYRGKSAHTIALSNTGKHADALTIFNANRGTFDKVNGTADAMQVFQMQVMDRMSAEAQASYNFSRNVIVAALVGTALLIVGLLITLVRAIATPLAGLTHVLGELGRVHTVWCGHRGGCFLEFLGRYSRKITRWPSHVTTPRRSPARTSYTTSGDAAAGHDVASARARPPPWRHRPDW